MARLHIHDGSTGSSINKEAMAEPFMSPPPEGYDFCGHPREPVTGSTSPNLIKCAGPMKKHKDISLVRTVGLVP